MDNLPDSYLVSAAAGAALDELEWDAAELFARHLSGDWGDISEEVHAMNTNPATARKVSSYWRDRESGLELVVIEEDHQLILCTTLELSAVELTRSQH